MIASIKHKGLVMKYSILASSFRHAATIEKVVSGKANAIAEAIKMSKTLPRGLGMQSGDMALLDVVASSGYVARFHVSCNHTGEVSIADRSIPKAVKGLEQLLTVGGCQ
jgi:ethanolamine utilization microcompartment shell protein EutS